MLLCNLNISFLKLSSETHTTPRALLQLLCVKCEGVSDCIRRSVHGQCSIRSYHCGLPIAGGVVLKAFVAHQELEGNCRLPEPPVAMGCSLSFSFCLELWTIYSTKDELSKNISELKVTLMILGGSFGVEIYLPAIYHAIIML